VSSGLHLALLRGASLLVRAAEREEWLAEWSAELWYVPGRRRMAFCLGAFRDAHWLRRHSPAPAHLESPWKCLAVLTLLAALSLFFAFRLPMVRELWFEQSSPAGLATISNISVDAYRQLPVDSSTLAYYGPARFDWENVRVALASRTLREVLKIRAAATADPQAAPLLLTETVWRLYFHGDPRIVGRRIIVEGRPAQVAAIVSDRWWRLPGRADAWLLVDEQDLAAESRGYVIARVAPATHRLGPFPCVPLSELHPLLNFLLAIAVAGVVLPTVTRMSLGEYPSSRHALSRTPEIRRWIFLAAKIALIVPMILFGSLDLGSLIAVVMLPQGLIVGAVIGFRWVLTDQRRRCPVCLRILSHPTTIGEPSRTLLEWYGTELVCAKGHGLLHVPEIRNSYSEQRWLHLDSSWSSLF
jgi:hypothetical protein